MLENESCKLCPRRCGVNRIKGERGACRMGYYPVVARAAAHFWEEPCISGINGSGTIFFSGCSMGCVYCQNYEISTLDKGKEISIDELRKLFFSLYEQGVHNINLVNPTHFTGVIAEALRERPPIPVVYNCGGYESVETLMSLEGLVDVYMPDLKYSNDALGERYSHVGNYSETAKAAILEMYRQTGKYELDEEGILQRGVLVRHLILPNSFENSAGVIKWIASKFRPGEILFSLMGQYIPYGAAYKYPEINRKLSQEEYDRVETLLFSLDIEDGFVQDLDSAQEEYIPPFSEEWQPEL